MSNIFNKTNSPYLIAGTLATLALLASEVFIAAPYFQFLAPVASLNVSFPFIIGCAVVSFAVMAFSCVMVASNIMKTESDDKVPILGKVKGCDQHDSEQEKGNKPDGEPKPEEGAQPDSEPKEPVGGARPGDQNLKLMADVLRKGLDKNSFKLRKAAGGQHSDNRANGTVGGTTLNNRANGTVAPEPVPDIVQDALSVNSFKAGKVKEEQHAKVFTFASFVITGVALFAANFLAGLIHSGVAVGGSGVALARGDIDQYKPGYDSTQFEADKNSRGTDHYRIMVFLQALKASNEGLSTALKEGKARGWDILPTSSLSHTQAEHNRELQVCS